MTTFKDLDPLPYFDRWEESLRAIGWIGSRGDYSPGVTSEESAELRKLRAEVRELRRANEILKAASAFFAAELDRPQR